MWANQHYEAFGTIFGLQVMGKSLELNPDHDQEMQDLEYYNHSTPIGGMQLKMRACMLENFLRLFLLQHSIVGSSSMVAA